MAVIIEEGRMDDLATAPTFNKEERADATVNPEERNHIQNLREQRLMDMLEHICVEVSNMSKAIQNMNPAQQPKPDVDKFAISAILARVTQLEANVNMLMAQSKGAWQPKGYPAPPCPSYDPHNYDTSYYPVNNRRQPRSTGFGQYDPDNYNTGFTGFGK